MSATSGAQPEPARPAQPHRPIHQPTPKPPPKENKKKKPFEVKLTKEGRPKGKITIQPTEMLPILFKAISEQSQQIEELQAQVKLLLEK